MSDLERVLYQRKAIVDALTKARRHRDEDSAALLEYLLGSGETGLARAYNLGRTAIQHRLGLLQIFRAHERALHAVLESPQSVADGVRRLRVAEDFLMETLSPFEMTYRGYVALLGNSKGVVEAEPPIEPRRPRRRRAQPRLMRRS